MTFSKNKNRNILFTISLLLILLQTTTLFGFNFSVDDNSTTSGLLPFAQKHVVIINKLVTHAVLVVHCKNKGEDLGIKSLGPGDSFDFRFRVNLRKTTRYTCTFTWPANVATFDIFRVDRDDNPKIKDGVCSECIWYIFEPAPCRARRDGGSPTCYRWTS